MAGQPLTRAPRRNVVRAVRALLDDAWETGEPGGVGAAAGLIADWYGLKYTPRVEFTSMREICRLAEGRTVGVTISRFGPKSSASIHLVKPALWRKHKGYGWGGRRRNWIDVALHELGHWALHAHEESHADEFKDWT